MSLLHLTANIKLIPVRPFDVESPLFSLNSVQNSWRQRCKILPLAGRACTLSVEAARFLHIGFGEMRYFPNSRSRRHPPSNFSTLLCIIWFFSFFSVFSWAFWNPPPHLSSPSHLSGLELVSKHWDFVIVYMKTPRIKPTKWNLKANVFGAASCP